jgi:WD40 repeat protein
LYFSPDGKILAGGGDKTVRLWDVAGGNEIRLFKGHEDPVMAVAFSPDGQRLVSSEAAYRGVDRGGIKVWDIASGKELASIQYAAPVMAVTFTPNGRQVIAAMGGMVGIWELIGPDGAK